MSGSEDDSYELEEHRLVPDPAIPGRWASIERVLSRGSPMATEGFVPDLNAVRTNVFPRRPAALLHGRGAATSTTRFAFAMCRKCRLRPLAIQVASAVLLSL